MSQDLNPFESPQTMATERPEVQWAADHTEELRKVKRGLALVYAGICGVLLGFLGIAVIAFSMGESVVVITVALLLLGLAAVSGLVVFAGQIFCLAVPKDSGARWLVLGTILLQIVTIAGVAIREAATSAIGDSPITVGSVNSLQGAAIGCFLLFLRRVANLIHRPDIAWRALQSLIAVLIVVAWYLGAICYVQYTRGVPSGWIIVPPMIAGLIALVMYANTVMSLRRAISL